MILKNDALQELYDTLSYGPVLSSPYTESPIDRAFKECDEKLSGSAAFAHIKDLENRCENLERSNKALRDDNDKISDKAIELAKKNEQLEKDIDIWKRSNEILLASSMESISKKRKLENEVEDLKKDLDAKDKENSTLISANADLSDRLAKLQRNFDRINHLWTSQIQENMELRSKLVDLKREKEGVEKELDDAKLSVDGWRRRAEESEKRFGELLLKKYDQSFEDLKKERDRYFGLYTELKKDYDRLFEENRSLKSKIIDFKKSITELQKKGDDLSKKAVALQQENEEMEKSRKHLRRLYVGEGARKLLEMLQNVNDSQPYEFDVECESMEDVIGMDLDDFLDVYKKWQEEKEQNEIDRMRKWLADFCYERDCEGCPLESNEYKCGCGYSFKKADESDTRIIPDEDIKRYYEKARGCGRYTLKDATFYFDNKPVKMENGKLFIHDLSHPMESINRGFTKACEDFCKAVRDADNKITENLRKGCTLEAKVEVNKDLLATVCGVKPKEEEHQLEYGDAVRVPWKNYDYMYIGPEGKHVRLFDPKTHAVVVVSVRDNLTYQGCKIILCDEDDIRKIWKDKK